MSADQVAEISPFLREVVEGYQSLPEESPTEWCATLEVEGRSDAWLQFMVGTLNFAYPSRQSPEVSLARILTPLPHWRLASWQPEQHVTIEFEPLDLRSLAKVIDALLAHLFSLGDYSINGTLELLPRRVA